MLNAITLSNSTGTFEWKGGLEICEYPFTRACAGEIEESGISESHSMLSIVRLAKWWAASRRAFMLSSENGAPSSGCGIRAKIAEIARLAGDRGSKVHAEDSGNQSCGLSFG